MLAPEAAAKLSKRHRHYGKFCESGEVDSLLSTEQIDATTISAPPNTFAGSC